MHRLTKPPVRPVSDLTSFGLQCSEIHPIRCHQTLSAGSQEALVALAMEHGARAHGFTPVWYSRARRRSISAAVALKHR